MYANSLTALRIALMIPFFGFMINAPTPLRGMALVAFLAAGLTEIADGYVARRLGEASKFGAMFDLIADRILTITVVVALIASRALAGPFVIAGVILIARDVIVAGLNEALPGRLTIRVTPIERVKIALQFIAFAILIAPNWGSPWSGLLQYEIGAWTLLAAAALAAFTTYQYCREAVPLFRPKRR
ncbi:hypothetical protein BH11PSE2_BH11PSE2_09930 [soil metagenome]